MDLDIRPREVEGFNISDLLVQNLLQLLLPAKFLIFSRKFSNMASQI